MWKFSVRLSGVILLPKLFVDFPQVENDVIHPEYPAQQNDQNCRPENSDNYYEGVVVHRNRRAEDGT